MCRYSRPKLRLATSSLRRDGSSVWLFFNPNCRQGFVAGCGGCCGCVVEILDTGDFFVGYLCSSERLGLIITVKFFLFLRLGLCSSVLSFSFSFFLLSVSVSVCLRLCVSVYLSVCLSVCLPLSPFFSCSPFLSFFVFPSASFPLLLLRPYTAVLVDWA